MKASITRVMDISMDEQISVLRDVTAMSLAGLGTAVTLLTVGGASKLIQTPFLFYMATLALGAGLVYAQWAREKLINYHTELSLTRETVRRSQERRRCNEQEPVERERKG